MLCHLCKLEILNIRLPAYTEVLTTLVVGPVAQSV